MQNSFSTFRVIHWKRECAVFSGERNVSARCLPAYNSCSSSRVSGTRWAGLSAGGSGSDWLGLVAAPPTMGAYWWEIGRLTPPARIPPRACHCRVRPLRNTKSARAVCSTVHLQSTCKTLRGTRIHLFFPWAGHEIVDKKIVETDFSPHTAELYCRIHNVHEY